MPVGPLAKRYDRLRSSAPLHHALSTPSYRIVCGRRDARKRRCLWKAARGPPDFFCSGKESIKAAKGPAACWQVRRHWHWRQRQQRHRRRTAARAAGLQRCRLLRRRCPAGLRVWCCNKQASGRACKLPKRNQKRRASSLAVCPAGDERRAQALPPVTAEPVHLRGWAVPHRLDHRQGCQRVWGHAL